jgi:hypothetical protein
VAVDCSGALYQSAAGARHSQPAQRRLWSPTMAHLERKMDIIDLLQSDEANLPFESNGDLEDFLRSKFDAYLQKVGDLSASEPTQAKLHNLLPDMRALADGVLSSLRDWLDAKPDLAFIALENGLAKLSAQLDILTSKPVDDAGSGPLYRVRVAELGARLTLADMFHIPFEKRDRVGSMRYSFPGLPCLYLGRSAFVCWEEMGRPNLHDLWISRYGIPGGASVRVLDFSHRPAQMAAGVGDRRANRVLVGIPDEMAAAYAALWPLIAACSVKRATQCQKLFVVEYVVPQLLLQWVLRQIRGGTPNHIDGIRYFSTHVQDHDVGIAGTNYVFPVQRRQKQGHCSVLGSKFHLTPPVNWQIAMAMGERPAYREYNKVSFEMTSGKKVEYMFTDFARFEAFADEIDLVAIPPTAQPHPAPPAPSD